MRKAVFSILAIMAIAVGVTAWGSAAHAKYVYLHPPSDSSESGSS